MTKQRNDCVSLTVLLLSLSYFENSMTSISGTNQSASRVWEPPTVIGRCAPGTIEIDQSESRNERVILTHFDLVELFLSEQRWPQLAGCYVLTHSFLKHVASLV